MSSVRITIPVDVESKILATEVGITDQYEFPSVRATADNAFLQGKLDGTTTWAAANSVYKMRNVSGASVIVADDDEYVVCLTGGATVTLPRISTVGRRRYIIMNGTSSVDTFEINATSPDTINGDVSFNWATAYGSIVVVSNTTLNTWQIH